MKQLTQTILHIDDDEDDQMLVQEIINQISPATILMHFSNGQSALTHLLKINEPDKVSLIILDINMPIMDGKMLLLKMKSNYHLSKIPVVLFTTSSSELDKTFARKQKVLIITKPYSASKLKEAVQRMLHLVA